VEPILAGIEWPPSFVGDRHCSLETETRMDELAEAGFVSSSFTLIRREHKLSAAQLRALYSTFSAIRLLPPEDARQRLDAIEQLAIRDFGGAAQRTILTPLYRAQAPH
jgi:hypothetical protein